MNAHSQQNMETDPNTTSTPLALGQEKLQPLMVRRGFLSIREEAQLGSSISRLQLGALGGNRGQVDHGMILAVLLGTLLAHLDRIVKLGLFVLLNEV